MISIPALWLPILLSAVIVFLASSLLHMVLTYHRSDYKKLPDEDGVLEAMRKQSLAPGIYQFPYCVSPKGMKSPAVMEKFKRGPVGLITVMPSGQLTMGVYLMKWFGYCLLVSVFAAYLAGRTLVAGTEYLAVFRVAGTTAFMGYGVGEIVNSIWRGQPGSVTAKHVLDGLIYSLLTGGTFGWLWPE